MVFQDLGKLMIDRAHLFTLLKLRGCPYHSRLLSIYARTDAIRMNIFHAGSQNLHRIQSWRYPKIKIMTFKVEAAVSTRFLLFAGTHVRLRFWMMALVAIRVGWERDIGDLHTIIGNM